jgi:O-antigen ligase
VAGEFNFLKRFSVFGTEDDLSSIQRNQSYAGAFTQFLESPLLGDSLEERTSLFYPHNLILESLMSVGVIGTVPLLFVLIACFHRATKLIRIRSPHGWIALIFIQQLVASQFSGAIYTSDTLWVCIAVLLSIKHFAPNIATDLRHESL